MRTHILARLWIGMLIGSTLAIATASSAITRDEVMVRARGFAYHPWRCEVKNLTASCSASYESVYTPGDYVGLPYDWGGYISLFEFDQEIADGAGAGSYPNDGVLDCTVGMDCSGYVTKCWDSGHYGTSTLQSVSTSIDPSEVRAGDVFNQPNYHVILYSHELANGQPILYEAIGYNVHINAYGGWAYTSGYDARRYDGITGTTAGDPIGTLDNPIPISSLPYTDSRDTTTSSSDVIDGCGAAASTPESGPEFVYEVTLTQPGNLTVSVSDDVGVDIDVHLFSSRNTDDCVARDDETFTAPVDCGTYLIVADTYGTGTEYAGAYTLNVSFAPTSGSCGSGPPAYNPPGAPGDPCGYPGHEDLPFCNPNLGGEVCLYTSGATSTSFCSHPCTVTSDCAAFAGGCCEDIGTGELYCMPASYCGSGPDAGPSQDAASESGLPDSASGQDSEVVDALDAGSEPSEASAPDAASQPDAGGVVDAAEEGGSDATPIDVEGSGCGCRAAGGGASAGWALVGLLGLLFLRPRKVTTRQI